MVTEISNQQELDAIRDDLSGDYELVDDIELEGEWEPLGDSNEQFTGTFDGGGFTITGLEVNHGQNAGLFGFTDVVEIGNVRLEDVNVDGGDLTGGLIGRAGDGFGGGGEIYQVQVTGTVSGGLYTGGIVGRTREVGEVTDKNSFIGTVNGGDQVGGIVGRSSNVTDISTCYVQGTVTGDSDVGGIVGNTSTVDSVFESMYAAVDTPGGAIVGNINSSDTFTDSVYWDEDKTPQPKESGSGGEESWIGLSTEGMQDEAARENMTNFDFENVWEVVTNDYPNFGLIVEFIPIDYLYESGNNVGAGSHEDEYIFGSGEQLSDEGNSNYVFISDSPIETG